ncbi:MAG: UvrD-helicase domain-containing protein [Thermoleophilaceae bacterium]|nr:UvrD-helicase domain-containing protein [Thermoleophilaceae bacterium]
MTLTPEQREAVDRRDGSLLVRAGAGTGKTTVLVERFVRSVMDDGLAVDAILAITFTEKAAAEMRERVRRRFLELGRREDARAAESASISTIHGFCARVLRTHALAAGIDPEYHVLDGLESERLALDAFEASLQDFLPDPGDPEAGSRLELMASYTLDGLRDMVRTAYSHLRSQGRRRPALPAVDPPTPAGEAGRLEAAARAAAAELGVAGGAAAATAHAKVERCIALIDRLGEGELAGPAAIDELGLGAARAKVLNTPACEEYREAHDAYRRLCIDAEHARSHALLRALLELYGDRYERLKRERSGLDFEDLELLTRDLLDRDDGLRDQLRERYAHVMVDEFQDVNPLQSELLGLVSNGNLFRVGDENQSIYGFRHADVGVFRRHREEAAAEGRALGVTVNFRSRGELIDAVALAFERLWGEDYEPLREAPGSREPAAAGPLVDLLVVDGHKGRWDEALPPEDGALGTAMAGIPPWRALEARLLAKRIDELTRHGPYEYRDVVVLLRATTSMSVYERALVERGIPTHVVGGRGYWSQQQVSDLRHWLTALANPLDELALYSVLASPLAGLSLDSVGLLALEARRGRKDPMRALREGVAGTDGLAELLPAADLGRARTFLERFDEERAAAPRVALETLIDRAVTRTGYDRHLLSLPAGERRMANVRKLMRMAREYEADEGRDLRGFIDAVAERDVLQEREGEAPLEAETLDAVRLMTIHRAKGLEFPVVAVGDLGKVGREDDGRLRISPDGTTGMRLASMGGGAVSSSDLDRIKAEQKVTAEEEEQRIFYVAATRAERHLILSGATDLEKLPEPSDLCEPMRWVWRSFCAGLPADGASGECADERDGRPIRVAWRRLTPDTLPALLGPEDLAPAAPPAAEPGGGGQQAELELAAVPAPRALPVSRLSYSGLEAYRRCSYRFYLERSLRLRPVDPPVGKQRSPAPGLTPLLRGSLVHLMLEELDFERPRAPEAEAVAALIEQHGVAARERDVEDLVAMVERFAGSGLRARIAAARRVRTELPFAFTLEPPGAGGRTLVVNGVVDVHATEPDGVLVVDYKSDPLDGRDPEELCAGAYATQRLVYGLAALRSGAARVVVAHCFLERPGDPAVVEYEAARAHELERELLEVARGVVEARFEPTADPHRELCADCPGRAALCSWGPEKTLAEPDSVRGSAYLATGPGTRIEGE